MNQDQPHSEGALARSRDGKVSLEYRHGSETRTVVWEPLEKGVAETVFDSEGAVLKRDIHHGAEGKDNSIDYHMKNLVKNIKLNAIITKEYSEVKLKKKCPSCNGAVLNVYEEKKGDRIDVPIMPLYECAFCQQRSYYLTDSYMDYLVTNNRDMFSYSEQLQLDANKAAFVAELKEYIIRIFAAKRIMRIK